MMTSEHNEYAIQYDNEMQQEHVINWFMHEQPIKMIAHNQGGKSLRSQVVTHL